ncbi:MAG TPA: hypothetical protein VKC51_02385 [Lacunisphaera sp.]|nr:hypothetical protein [Lacunisphaera sp.]
MNLFKNIPLLALLTGTAVLSAQSTPTPPAVTTLSTGFDYSRGDYGFTTNTEVFSTPLNLGYENHAWALSANFSYLRIKGPATVVAGSGTARPTSASESGLGDIYLGATYHFGPVAEQTNLDATARVKLPTADEARGLGTGAADYYGELTLSHIFTSVTPFATAGYRVLGDTATYQLRNGVYASGGAHFRVSPTSIVTALLNWRQPIVQGSDSSFDATAMFTRDYNARWRVMAYATKGFTNASPDVGAGFQASYRF